MKNFKDYVSYFFKSMDLWLLITCILTSVYGTMMVYSATLHDKAEGDLLTRDARTMIIAVIIGLVAASVFSLFDYETISKLWPLWAGLSILLMVIVFIFGVAPSNRSDARTWLNLGLFYFQPSELVKVFFVITFSTHLQAVREELNTIKNVALLLGHALIPFVLVAVSGDDGSALVFLLMAVVMLFVAGLNWKYIVGGIALVAAAIPLLWTQLNDFQKQRFYAIIHPEDYPSVSYQQNLGRAAMANGGIFGQGYLQGSYTQSGSVPVSESDMIFTVIGEEFGFVGCLVALGLLTFIVARIIRNGRYASMDLGVYMSYGIASMIAVQALINIAMCLRIGPVIGITLPFFSAGGSSTLCLYTGLGLVFSIYRSNYNQSRQTSFRLIGIRSPFNENFSDNKEERPRMVSASERMETKANDFVNKINEPLEKKKKQKERKKTAGRHVAGASQTGNPIGSMSRSSAKKQRKRSSRNLPKMSSSDYDKKYKRK